MTDPNREQLIATVQALGDLTDDLVFVGGSVAGLLITDPGSEPVRPTEDVDAIVEVTSRVQYERLTERLHTKGFRPDPDGPLCRYIKDTLMIDVMPLDASILGFSNRWYPTAMQQHTTIALNDTTRIEVVTAPIFIATKLEAFKDRGASDPIMSHDLEDILMIVDGRMELISEITSTIPELRDYLTAQFLALRSSAFFDDLLSGTFRAARGQIVRGRWDAITGQADTGANHA